jgi:hypothetical protein
MFIADVGNKLVIQFAKYGIEFPTVTRITLSLDLNPQFEAVRNLKLPAGNRPGEE